MIIVHHLNYSRSQRILWLLEELDESYEIKTYERDPKTMLAPAALKEIHPLGKSPVIEDDGVFVAESGAIIEYLLSKHPDSALKPAAGTQAYRDYLYWLHYAEGSAMAPLLLQLVFKQLPVQGPWLAKPLLGAVSKTVLDTYVNKQVRTHMKYWETSLADRAYFAGDNFSAADIQMSYVLEAAIAGNGSEKYPRIVAQIEKNLARKCYKVALEKGGPVIPPFRSA